MSIVALLASDTWSVREAPYLVDLSHPRAAELTYVAGEGIGVTISPHNRDFQTFAWSARRANLAIVASNEHLFGFHVTSLAEVEDLLSSINHLAREYATATGISALRALDETSPVRPPTLAVPDLPLNYSAAEEEVSLWSELCFIVLCRSRGDRCCRLNAQ